MIHSRAVLLLPFLILLCTGARTIEAQESCRCHSKNPAMKRMHEIIGFTSCGNCHAKDENLVARRKNPVQEDAPKKRLKKRIQEDPFCIPCHNSDGSAKKNMAAAVNKMNISGTLFCAKDKFRFPAGARSCPKCGSRLINISESMGKSRENPSNAICIECHPLDGIYEIRRHGLFNAAKLKKCLDCHQGHDDCGS